MDLHGRWTHRWRHPNTVPINSRVHGLGLAATGAIKAGEMVFVYSGLIVPSSEISEYWKSMGHIGIQIDDNFFIVPASRQELEREGVINHSCEPNTGFRNQIELVSLRYIKPGEEITFDYAMCETLSEPFECKCGSKSCRKTITKEDWRIPELQEKYGEYFSPYLKTKLV